MSAHFEQFEQSSEQEQEQQLDQNVLQNLDLTLEQMQTLSNTVSVTVDIKINRLKKELRQLLIDQQWFSSNSFLSNLFSTEQNLKLDSENARLKKWTSKKVTFFDFIADDLESVVNLKKHRVIVKKENKKRISSLFTCEIKNSNN